MKERIRKNIDEIFDKVKEVRCHLHQHPELSFKEIKTTEYLMDIFPKEWKISRVEGITGFIADYIVNEEYLTLLFRAEIDGLPMQEESNLPFSSVNDGVMHACGHDLHATILYAAACILSKEENSKLLKHNLRFIFQPAEELLPGGAKYFIENGVLDGINPTAAFALHLSPELPTRKIGLYDGPFMASGDEIYVTVHGKGGHAALIDHNIDPIVIGSHIVLYINNINQMELSGNKHISVIGNFIAKGATNITPSDCFLQGTMRTFNESDRNLIKTMIKEYVDELENQYGCTIDLNIKEGYPTLFNNHGVVEKIKNIIMQNIDSEAIEYIPQRTTADDFAYFTYIVPSCMMRLGCGNGDRTGKLHSSTFCPDEECMRTGIEAFVMLALNFY